MLARDEQACARWRRAFIDTFVERDLPRWGVRVAATALRRFWTMVAHYHGHLELALIRRAMRIAIADLELERVAIVYPGTRRYAVADRVAAAPPAALAQPGRFFGVQPR